METKYTTAGREWTAGERVIIVSTSRTNPAPRVRPVESVAEKSFVVDGNRYMKDKLQDGVPVRWIGTGWDRYSVAVIPLDHPDASYLVAERALFKQGRLVETAQKMFNQDRTTQAADLLRTELGDWIEARNLYDAERKIREIRGR